MAVKINSRHGKLSDNTKEHIEKACAKLHQFFDRIIDCEVVIDTKKKHGTLVEIIVKVPNQTLVGKAESDDDNLFKSIDDAGDRVGTQLKKYHDKLVEDR